MRFKAFYAYVTNTKYHTLVQLCPGARAAQRVNIMAMHCNRLLSKREREGERQADTHTDRQEGWGREDRGTSFTSQKYKFFQFLSKFKGHQFGQKSIAHLHIMMTCTNENWKSSSQYKLTSEMPVYKNFYVNGHITHEHLGQSGQGQNQALHTFTSW